MMEKEADVTEMQVLSLYFPAGTRKNHKNSPPLYMMQGLYFGEYFKLCGQFHESESQVIKADKNVNTFASVKWFVLFRKIEFV
jgi:hypothetical protein